MFKLPSNSITRFLPLALILVGGLARVVFSIYQWMNLGLDIAIDQLDYIQYAEQMALQGIWVPKPQEIVAFSGPGFPFYVFLLNELSGGLYGVVAMNILLSILTIMLHYKASYRLFGFKVALLVLAISALYVPFFIYTGLILKETLLYFLIAALIFLNTGKSTSLKLLLIALCFVFTFHVDERFLLYAPILLLVTYWRDTFKKAVHLGLLMLLFSAPWLIRNYIVYDRVVVLTERFQSPFDRKLGNENSLNSRNEEYSNRMKVVRDSLIAGHAVKFQSSRERKVAKAIKQGIVPHDYSLLERVYNNLKSFWWPIRTKPTFINDGWKYRKERPTLYNIGYSLFLIPAIVFTLIGLILSLKSKDFVILLFIGIMLYHTLLHVLMISGLGRYRITVDVFLFMTTVWVVFQLLNRLGLTTSK